MIIHLRQQTLPILHMLLTKTAANRGRGCRAICHIKGRNNTLLGEMKLENKAENNKGIKTETADLFKIPSTTSD